MMRQERRIQALQEGLEFNLHIVFLHIFMTRTGTTHEGISGAIDTFDGEHGALSDLQSGR